MGAIFGSLGRKYKFEAECHPIFLACELELTDIDIMIFLHLGWDTALFLE